jgi:hypothetical protein
MFLNRQLPKLVDSTSWNNKDQAKRPTARIIRPECGKVPADAQVIKAADSPVFVIGHKRGILSDRDLKAIRWKSAYH